MITKKLILSSASKASDIKNFSFAFSSSEDICSRFIIFVKDFAFSDSFSLLKIFSSILKDAQKLRCRLFLPASKTTPVIPCKVLYIIYKNRGVPSVFIN